MGFTDSSLFLKITFVLLIVALIIQILGLALPYWYSVDGNNSKVHGGLFRFCYEEGNRKECKDNSNLPNWFEATQAFEILGFLLIIGALVVTVIVVFVKSDMKILKLIAWLLSFTACAFILIGVCIYGGEAEAQLAEYSGAFAITIIAGIFCLAAGVLGVLDWIGIKI